MEQKYIVALELSGSQVKGAVAAMPASAFGAPYPTIESLAFVDNTDCVQYGRVQNVLNAATHTKFVLQKMSNDPKLASGKIVGAYVGVAGRSLSTIRKEGVISLSNEMVITEEIINHVYAEALKGVPGDKKVLEIVPRRFIIDNQVTANPVGSLGKQLRGEFTIVVANPTNVRNLDMLFGDNVKLPVFKYIVTPLAIGNLVLSEEEKALGCVLVDFGAQTTTVSIYKDRSLQYIATLPLGSANITHDIALGTNTTDERAEMLKINQGNAQADATTATDGARINSYVNARTGEIIANIMAQINFAGYKPGDLPQGFIITGRGIKLRNFDKQLESQSKMKVRRASIPGIMNVSVGDPNDFTSLVSLVTDAAKLPSVKNCVEIAKQSQPDYDYKSTPDYEEPEDDPQDDDFWDVDDDEAERLRADRDRRRRADAEKAAREAEKARQRDADRERHRREQAEVADTLDDEGDEEDKTQKQKKGRWIDNIGHRLQNLFSYDEERDDTSLD